MYILIKYIVSQNTLDITKIPTKLLINSILKRKITKYKHFCKANHFHFPYNICFTVLNIKKKNLNIRN